MKRAFYFSVAAAAALGFATSAWAQAAGGAGGASGSAGAGASGSAGAGASGSAGAGAAGTGGAGANAGTTGQAAAGNAGANNGVGASNGLGANNGVNTNNNAVNTGVNSRSGFGNTGTSGRTNANAGGARSNLNPNAGESGTNAGGLRSNLNPNAGENGISQNPFFSNQAVRQQLRMNDTQFNSLNRAYQDAYSNYQNSLNGLGKNLTADQRTQQMEMLQNKFNDRFNQNVNSTLTDPGVRSRFEQLNRQYMGLSNFNNPAIQKQLNLTPQQLNQIRQLSTSIRSQESNANPSLNQSQLYSQTWDQLNSILTPQQQQTWSQLTGERFDFGNAGASGNVQSSVSNGFPGTGNTNGNGNGTVIGNGDPKNNLTAPRPGSGGAPFGTAPGTNGNGANPGNTGGANGNAAAGGAAGATGTAGSTSGTGTGNTGSTTGSGSSSK